MNFKMKNKIMLFIKNIKQIKLKKKLTNKYTRFFEIENVIEKQTYQLRLFLK